MRETALRLAIEEENRRKTDPNETHERSIIILGSKGIVSDKIREVYCVATYFAFLVAFLG